MKRIRRSTEVWQKIIRQQEQSGVSATAFCEEQGLSTKTFYRRRKALHLASTETPKSFIKIEAEPIPLQPTTSVQPMVLHYGEIKLSLPVSTDPSWMADLMKALS